MSFLFNHTITRTHIFSPLCVLITWNDQEKGMKGKTCGGSRRRDLTFLFCLFCLIALLPNCDGTSASAHHLGTCGCLKPCCAHLQSKDCFICSFLCVRLPYTPTCSLNLFCLLKQFLPKFLKLLRLPHQPVFSEMGKHNRQKNKTQTVVSQCRVSLDVEWQKRWILDQSEISDHGQKKDFLERDVRL